MAKEDVPDTLDLSLHGGGSSNQWGMGGGGRATLNYTRGNTTISPYIEGGGFVPKNGEAMGSVSGYGIQIRQRFKNGGLVKAPKSNMKKAKPC